MAGRASNRIARRLGGPAVRRRRHRRVALVVLLVAVLGAGLVAAGSGTDDAPVGVAAACRASNEEIATAQRALLDGNAAPGAIEGFLGDAFVDLARDRAAAIRAAVPSDEILAIVEAHDAVVDAIERDPAAAAGLENPFTDVNERWRRAGLADCAIDTSTVPT